MERERQSTLPVVSSGSSELTVSEKIPAKQKIKFSLDTIRTLGECGFTIALTEEEWWQGESILQCIQGGDLSRGVEPLGARELDPENRITARLSLEQRKTLATYELQVAQIRRLLGGAEPFSTEVSPRHRTLNELQRRILDLKRQARIVSG